MGTPAILSDQDLVISALRWWRDAGVDMVTDEKPRQWLAAADTTRVVTKPEPKSAVAVVPSAFPTLAALTQWLATAADVAEAGPPARRVLPAGDPACELMVITDCPDHADVEAGFLLAGALGTLFEKMLAALIRDRTTIYLAALCPGRPARGLVSDAAFDALAPVLRRHVELVAPKQLWLLGTAASRAILGIGDIAAHGKLHQVNLNGVIVSVVVTAHPRFLTTHERKLRAWTEMQRLLEKDVM